MSDFSPEVAKPEIRCLARIGLTVKDLDASEAFYTEALSFERLNATVDTSRTGQKAYGTQSGETRTRILRLGRDEIELVSFHPEGRDYPAERVASDLWFQHFAIVVSDMDEAYRRLRGRPDLVPISTGGPQLLPPNTGSVTAYKFRDPDGHPLELTMLPTGVGAARWHETRTGAIFLGIDHSAISVADMHRSIAFYSGLLGMKVTFQSLNTGPEQERLDGFSGATVDIVSLQPQEPASPHLELLSYRNTRAAIGPLALQVNDIAATRLIFRTGSRAALLDRLHEAGIPSTELSGSVEDAAFLLRDPDGHIILLVE